MSAISIHHSMEMEESMKVWGKTPVGKTLLGRRAWGHKNFAKTLGNSLLGT
jgi:hypothetical protein